VSSFCALRNTSFLCYVYQTLLFPQFSLRGVKIVEKWQFRSIDDMLETVVFNSFKKAISYKMLRLAALARSPQ